jgi:hypothetical protein
MSEEPLASDPDNSDGFIILQPDLLEPDQYYTTMRQKGILRGSYMETPYGIYYNQSDNFLYYSQYGTTKYLKLCTKTDCSHEYDNCDAFIGENKPIAYYKDHIYYVSSDIYSMKFYLYKMDMDGKNREKVKQIYEEDAYTGVTPYGILYDGYYYFIRMEGSGIGESQIKDHNLYRLKIDDDSKCEVVFTNDLISDICAFTVAKDNIFFYIKNSGSSGYDANTYKETTYDLYAFSIETNEWTHLSDQWPGLSCGYFDEVHAYCYKFNDGFYELDLDSKLAAKVKNTAIEGGWKSNAFYSEDLIYIINFYTEGTSLTSPYRNQTLFIFDRQYNLIDQIFIDYITDDSPTGNMVADIGDYIIFASDYNSTPDFYLIKSDIGTGNLAFHEIVD